LTFPAPACMIGGTFVTSSVFVRGWGNYARKIAAEER
jgi:hypothetical protein